ncbi:MAG TPA: hypothetical protein VMX17_01565 [Candidatus Glassbacteria bacterium]|nr:hypothetical protein [Candidatus Glassbacteria bacterium]
MINLASNKFNTEVIFLQPTFDCSLNCQGCYVKEKEHKFDSKNMSVENWIDLIRDAVLLNQYIDAEQVTMAIDSLPQVIGPVAFMLHDVLDEFLVCTKAARKINPNKEFHITCNSTKDLMDYFNNPNSGFVLSRWVDGYSWGEGITMVSISNIEKDNDLEYIRQIFPNAKINWNILSSTFIKYKEDRIIDTLKQVDMAYLLLHKAPLGEQGHKIKEFKKAYVKVKELKKKYSNPQVENSCTLPSMPDKIVFDGCITDSIEFSRSGNGCSSNVSRFQVWPDGKVTGCAYNSHQQYGVPAKNIQDVTQNLKDARLRYEFNSCTIPKELGLKNGTDRRRLAVIQ